MSKDKSQNFTEIWLFVPEFLTYLIQKNSLVVPEFLTYLLHFKMYITINDVIGEKRIDLSYPIHSGKEVAVIRMLSDNVQYQVLKLHSVMDHISDTKKMIPSRTYAGRELLSMLEGIVELNEFLVDDQVIKKNKLKGIMEMILNLDELDNSNNLKDGRPSNELLTYHVTDDKDFTSFEPQTPQYRKPKNDTITPLTLRITDQNNNITIDGPQVTIVLHIKCNPL